MQVTLPNRRTVTLTNIATFGEFIVGDIPRGGSAIVFKGKCYDTRSNRKYAEWCAKNFKPDHAERHMARGQK